MFLFGDDDGNLPTSPIKTCGFPSSSTIVADLSPSSPIFSQFPSSPITGNVNDDSDNEEIKQTLEKLDYYSSSSSPSTSGGSSSSGSSSSSSCGGGTTQQGSSDDLCESFCYRSRTNKRTLARRRRSRPIRELSQVLQESQLNFKDDVDLIYSSSSSGSSQDPIEQKVLPSGLFSGFHIIAPDLTLEERDQYTKLVKDNGGVMTTTKKGFTWYCDGLEELGNERLILISDSPKARPSYLAALMLNIPLLKKEWITDCLAQQTIIINDDNNNIMEKYLLSRGMITTTTPTIINGDNSSPSTTATTTSTTTTTTTTTTEEIKQVFNSTFHMLKKEQRPLFGVSVKINSSDVKFIESWKKILESGGATVGDIATYSSKHCVGATATTTQQKNRNFVLVKDSSEISRQRLDYFNIKKVPILNKDSLIRMIVTSDYNFENFKIVQLAKESNNKPSKPHLTIPPLPPLLIGSGSLDDSLQSPYCNLTPTPSVIPNRRIFFDSSASSTANNLARSKWFSNVKQDHATNSSMIQQPQQDLNASVIDIRTQPQSAKKKKRLPQACSKKLERSFSTNNSFMNNSLHQINTSMINTSMIEEASKATFDDLSSLTQGDYFLKQEKTNQQKTCFVRLTRQKVLCGKRKYEESTDWKLDQFFVGDVVTISAGPFTDSKSIQFIRIDQLYYKDYVTESKEMLGTEYIPDQNKKLISTSKVIRVDLSSINHKLLIGNLETGTTKKKRLKKQYYTDYVFKNFDFKEIEDPSVKNLHVIPHELAQLSDLEMKRERKIKSVRMKNPFFVRFTGADFNGKIFEEGNFVKLHERDSTKVGPLICVIREIRERDVAHFCNQFTAYASGATMMNNNNNGLEHLPPPLIRPSPSSSVLVEILQPNSQSPQHYTFTHQVEEIMFARIHSLEPLVAIEKNLVGESFDLTLLGNQNDLIIVE